MSQYEKLGTSATKAALHQALKSAGLTESGRYFAQLFPDIAGDPEYLSFSHCDGAGTKAIVAYLMYKELGNAETFRGIAQDAFAMNLDDVFCVGPVEGLMLSNAIARNAAVVGEDVLTELFKGYKDFAEMLSTQGIRVQLAGGETADVGDVVRTVLVDATLCGRVQERRLVDTTRISPGDVIIGVASYGRSIYETKLNSGIGSNGLTLARHALLSSEYQEKYPETTSKGSSTTKAVGKFKLNDSPSGLEMSIGEALLSPTRTYAPLLVKLFSEFAPDIHGLIHNTGGGLTKVLRFGKGCRYVKDNLLPVPTIFSLIQSEASVSEEEMYRVFNMGQRLEIYIEQKHLKSVLDIAESFHLEAKQIGYVEASGDPRLNEVVLRTPREQLTYSHHS